MVKRALLVGCNYPGTKIELQGCVNDVFNMKKLYEDCFGFEDFTILIDTDPKYQKPTGRQIKASLSELVEKSQPGDMLVMHFSGHGTQVPSDDPREEDMMDEALVPTDMNLLLDDDLREIVKKLADDVTFTFISDCCHSGGMLDHAEIQIKGPKTQKAVPQFGVSSVLAAFGLKDKGLPPEEVKNRSLPSDILLQMIGGESGKEVDKTNVRSVMTDVFGKDASSKITHYVTLTASLLGGSGGCLGRLGQMFGLKPAAPKPTEDELNAAKPGHKPPDDQQLEEDKGILITGCQSDETSADACPGGDPGKAYGALSNAVQTVVRELKKKNKDAEISNSDLVYSVRKLLADGYYGQNPCLECSLNNANKSFITGKQLN